MSKNEQECSYSLVALDHGGRGNNQTRSALKQVAQSAPHGLAQSVFFWLIGVLRLERYSGDWCEAKQCKTHDNVLHVDS